MPGKESIDKMCSHEASQGLIEVQLLESKHILEIFVHLDEAKDEKDLLEIARRRTYDHTINAIALLKGKTELSEKAGKGIRQGRDNAGEIIWKE